MILCWNLPMKHFHIAQLEFSFQSFPVESKKQIKTKQKSIRENLFKMLTNLSGPIIMILLATTILAGTILFIFGKRQIVRFTLKSKWDENYYWFSQDLILRL